LQNVVWNGALFNIEDRSVIFIQQLEKTSPCPDEIYIFQNYFQIFWKDFTRQWMSIKNTKGRNDVQCPYIYPSCKTRLHCAFKRCFSA